MGSLRRNLLLPHSVALPPPPPPLDSWKNYCDQSSNCTMRWPHFLLTLINLAFAIYILVLNVFLVKEIDPFTFLWALIYIALALALSHLYMLYMSNKIDDWYDIESIRSINNLAVCFLIICASTLLITLGFEYYKTKTIVAFNGSTNLLKTSFVPLAASLLSSLILYTSSIKFQKYITLCQSIDLQPTQKKNYQTTDQ